MGKLRDQNIGNINIEEEDFSSGHDITEITSNLRNPFKPSSSNPQRSPIICTKSLREI
jgi:hypothetical protein